MKRGKSPEDEEADRIIAALEKADRELAKFRAQRPARPARLEIVETRMSASDAQRAANQANALRSTGPRDTSRTRYNATRHGILSEHFFLDAEDHEAFDELQQHLLDSLHPVGAIEEFLADKLLAVMWRWRRVIQYETETLGGAGAWRGMADSLPEGQALANIERYEAHLSRQFYKALHELQRLQAFRLGKDAKVPEAVDITMSRE